ncbi:MAG TPA: methylmalonyl-CoA mutase, partial [Acidimicrobiaceae bacterium]|nr:methylmalonyl-CoA mutase [Acidimicrobiaceae bacterium]
QTAGVSLTAQQPEVNIVRTALEALAGVLGGTQSLHTNSMDEVLALPTDKAARIALRTQQVVAYESGVANVADPLGGSWFVETLTDEVEQQAEAIFSRLDEWGEGSMLEGVLRAVEDNWFQAEIADSAYQFQRKVATGRRVVVGVNAFTDGNDEAPPPTLQIGPEVDEAQRKRLAAVHHARSEAQVQAALSAVSATAAEPAANLVPPVLDAVRAYATVGEIVAALASVFGRWAENPVV